MSPSILALSACMRGKGYPTAPAGDPATVPASDCAHADETLLERRFGMNFESCLASFWDDFVTFLRSDGLPGPPVGGLGLPWAPKVTPRRVPRRSGGGFFVDLGDPGDPLETDFASKSLCLCWCCFG